MQQPIASAVTLKLRSELLNWWAQEGSNLRPPACKAGALPLSYAPGPSGVALRCAESLLAYRFLLPRTYRPADGAEVRG